MAGTLLIGRHHFCNTLDIWSAQRSADEATETTQEQHHIVLAQSPVVLVSDDSSMATTIQWLLDQIHNVWQNLWDVLSVTWRGVQVVGRLSPLVILTPAAVVSHYAAAMVRIHNHPWHNDDDGDADQIKTTHRTTTIVSDFAWYYVTSSMQALGPVFVKLCQWIATRPDIFPPHVCERLSCLHDRGLPHAWKYTHEQLVEAFGPDYEEKGLSIDPDAVIGCGSAAQVYRGMLTKKEQSNKNDEVTITTRPVAVKVLHPQFSRLVERDLELLRILASWCHAVPLDVIRMLNLPRVASNFGTLLRSQDDLRVEAAHLQQFRRNFYGRRRHHFLHSQQGGGEDEQNDAQEADSAITFPRPVPEWTSTNVLVEDLVTDARPIAEFLRDETPQGIETRRALAGPLLRAFLKMIFIDNYTHGDLHPGNVFVQTQEVPVQESSQWWSKLFSPFRDDTNRTTTTEQANPNKVETITKRTIVFLDAGIATTLSPSDQRNLIDLFRAVILNQGETAGRLMVERAKYERCSQTPGGVQAFSKGIGDLVAEFHDNRKAGLTLGAVRIGSLLSRVLDLCRIHGVEIDPAMASIVVSTLVLEGLGRSLEPSLNLMDFAMPFVLGRGKV